MSCSSLGGQLRPPQPTLPRSSPRSRSFLQPGAPPGLLAAADASDLPLRRFLADAVALLAACGMVAGAGYGRGLAQRQSGIWLTVAGVEGLVALSGTLTWYLWHGPDGPS
jgi:hypothetical protein